MDKLYDRNLFGLFLRYFEIGEIKKLIRKDKYILNFIIKNKWCISELDSKTIHWINFGFKNIIKLDISHSNIQKILKELINLECLICSSTQIKEIPKELINLKILSCFNTKIKVIPKELVNLELLSCFNTKIKVIPKELVNLKYLNCPRTDVEHIPK